MTTTAKLTEIWADTIIKQLFAQGVKLFCIAPGSRSTPLIRSVSKLKDGLKIVHFDERGCGFFSLGAAKAKKDPSCVIVTSGSAPGHLLPSIMEAKNSSIPLIVLTADRPKELHNCGSNQTIEQSKMFQNYVKWQVDLTEPSEQISPNFIRSIIAEACSKALSHPMGPIHINIPFREPFISNSELENFEEIPPLKVILKAPSISVSKLKDLAGNINQHQKGIIIAGYESFLNKDDVSALETLSKKLNFPIFADIVSGLRSKNLENMIEHYTLLTSLKKVQETLSPTCVIHFGKQYTSKPLLYWLKKINPSLMIQIEQSLEIQDPFHHTTHKVVSDPLAFCQAIHPLISQNQNSMYLNEWMQLSKSSKELLHQSIEDCDLSEAMLFKRICSKEHFENTNLFLSASMPIRNADAYFFPKTSVSIYSSRGVSGIDGSIATSIGMSYNTKRKTIAILGDQTTLHDLNSLALLKYCKKPVIFFVINNSGGTIFSMLPIYEDKPCYDKYFLAKHNYNFRPLAEMFGLGYQIIDTKRSLETVLDKFDSLTSHMIFEVKTPSDQNHLFQKNALRSLEDLFAIHS